MSQSLFPIDNAERHLRTFTPTLERSVGTLRWSCNDGISELSVVPVPEQRTLDGLFVSEVVALTHIARIRPVATRDNPSP